MQFVDGRESLASVAGACQRVSVERNQVGAIPARLPRQHEFRNCSLRHALVGVRQAEHGMGHGIARIKVQRPLELRDGLVVAPGHVQNDAEVDLRVQRQRVETDRRARRAGEPGWRSGIRQVKGIEVQRGDVIRLEFNRALEVTFCFRPIPVVVGKDRRRGNCALRRVTH